MSRKLLFLLTFVVALVLLSSGLASAGTGESGIALPMVWNWVDSLLSDQRRMVQAGALVVVLAIFVLVRK